MPADAALLLPKCYANPLLSGSGAVVTPAMWDRSEAEAAKFMASQTQQLMRTLQASTAANVNLTEYTPRKGVLPDGTILQNRSVDAIQPEWARRWDLFNFWGDCPVEHLRSGRAWDGSKFVCGMHVYKRLRDKCVVYSVGSNNDFTFEEAIVASSKCEIHTFDCNVVPAVPTRLQRRVTFHRWCLGARDEVVRSGIETGHGSLITFKTWDTTLRELKHSHVDLLKMDIEGYEWDVYDGMLRSTYPLPFQITTELHLTAFWNSANLWWAGRKMTAGEVALWARRFYDVGYRVAKRAGHARWPQSKEVTLVRFRC